MLVVGKDRHLISQLISADRHYLLAVLLEAAAAVLTTEGSLAEASARALRDRSSALTAPSLFDLAALVSPGWPHGLSQSFPPVVFRTAATASERRMSRSGEKKKRERGWNARFFGLIKSGNCRCFFFFFFFFSCLSLSSISPLYHLREEQSMQRCFSSLGQPLPGSPARC